MDQQNRIVKPGYKIGTVLTEDGNVLTPPEDWAFLPAGDGPLTRNVKKRGCCWQVQVQKGRRTISKGIWTKEEYILAAKKEVEQKRSTPEYTRRKITDKRRRDRKHNEYVDEFYRETLKYLHFHVIHQDLAEKLAWAVTEHATPVGSGTVARTKRIPVQERVEAAVIAWLRHQTTAYDTMHIARIKGRRREVRKKLAERSKELLDSYRSPNALHTNCPLSKALEKTESNPSVRTGV
jgi:hypothetical protein